MMLVVHKRECHVRSVSTVAVNGLDNSDSVSGRDKNFSLRHCVQTESGTIQLIIRGKSAGA
jgi:hypothetical protein